MLGRVDLRQLALARSRLEAAVKQAFERDADINFPATKFGLDQSPSKGPNIYTIYIVTDEDPTGLWALHGYSPNPKSIAALQDAFAGRSQAAGATLGNVSIISADRTFSGTFSQDDFLLSNVMKHELGHGFTGVICQHGPETDAAICGGVMMPVVGHQNLDYTEAFVTHVKTVVLKANLLIATEPRYTAIWQASTEDEIQLYDWTTEDLRAKYDELWPEGWRLKLLNPYVLNGEVRNVAVFQPGEQGEIQVYDLTYEGYRTEYDAIWQQGWRLKLLSNYVVNNEVRYTAVWQPSTEDEIQAYGLTFSAYRAEYDALWQQGWRLKLLSNYVVNNEVRYTAVWRQSTEDEIQLYNWTTEDLRAKYDELWPEGWRLKLLNPYVLNGEVRNVAVFQPGEQGEIQVYDLTYEGYRTEYGALWQQGWRLKLLKAF